MRRAQESDVAHKRVLRLIKEAHTLRMEALHALTVGEFQAGRYLALSDRASWADAKYAVASCESSNARRARAYALDIVTGKVKP
jgi:hypothetical protein